MLTVQDFLISDLLENEVEEIKENETVELLEFIRKQGVALTGDQAKAIFILKEYGLSDLSNYVLNVKQHMTPFKRFLDVLKMITLADRIKGNAKLSSILKANANPANATGGYEAMAKANRRDFK